MLSFHHHDGLAHEFEGVVKTIYYILAGLVGCAAGVTAGIVYLIWRIFR